MQDFSPATDCQEITYTMFDKVRHITIGNFMPSTIEFSYGFDHQRTGMQIETSAAFLAEKTYVGNCEFVDYGGGDESYTFISGPLGVFAVVEKKVNGVESVYYVLKDHLGSWTTVTDAEGTVEREQSFDAWGNARNPETWSGGYNSMPMFNRGFTGHEHLMFGKLINMNGRMYDPVMSSFLSVDNYVQAPDFSQSFNRYAYCLNNPLRYTDPDGEEFITAAIIIGGVIIGAYTGGALANGGNYNITQWNWDMGTTIGVIGGGIAGGLSAGAGFAVAGAGFSFCNTTAIAASSLAYSTGMYATGKLAGFDYNISMSIGVASYNFTKGELGYLFKEGNSVWDNIGYGLGALTNASDIYRFATWDVLSKQQRYDKLQKWAAKKYGEQNLEYVPNMGKDHGNYDILTDQIQLSDKALSKDFGCAKSTYMHEYNHRIKMLPHKNRIEQLALMQAMGEPGASEALKRYYDTFDTFAYEFELQNAAQNGLSLRQFQMIRESYLYYSSTSGLASNQYNYTIWHLLKSILLPYW
ncbi:MAG: hypothetical protein IJM74_06785 [Bacteroidales bacterium]|nr:hypothetical protein [Bacteroidales bacterium]